MRRSWILRITAVLLLALLLPAAGTADDSADSEPAATPEPDKAAEELSYRLSIDWEEQHPYARKKLFSLMDWSEETERYGPNEYLTLRWRNKAVASFLVVQWQTIPDGVSIEQYDADGALLKSEQPQPFYDTYHMLAEGVDHIVIQAGEAGMELCRIGAFGDGLLPEPFRPWQTAPDHLDYLIVSTHPDDDTLFMGAIVPIYGAEQGFSGTVAYVTYQRRYRTTEAENGVWTMGSHIYPFFLGFMDINGNYEQTMADRFRVEDVTRALVRLFRKCRPLVVFSHDVNGEYGHWQHKIVSAAVTEAARLAGDESYDPESVAEYGAWQVRKCYLHLYPENPLVLDIRTPLASMNNKTALTIAKEAFKRHSSQQNGRHEVQDEYGPLSLNRFGMVYGVVEAGEDAFDNIDPALFSFNRSEEPLPTDTPEPTDTPSPAPTATPAPTDTPSPTATPVPTVFAASMDTPAPTAEPKPAAVLPKSAVWIGVTFALAAAAAVAWTLIRKKK